VQLLIGCLSLLSLFLCLKCRVLLLFCSNPDALGIDVSEKGIFDSLNNIAQLPPSPPKDGDRLDDSAAGKAESPAAEEAGKESSTTLVSVFVRGCRLVFCHAFSNIFVFFRQAS
jgi:hypothetical protein